MLVSENIFIDMKTNDISLENFLELYFSLSQIKFTKLIIYSKETEDFIITKKLINYLKQYPKSLLFNYNPNNLIYFIKRDIYRKRVLITIDLEFIAFKSYILEYYNIPKYMVDTYNSPINGLIKILFLAEKSIYKMEQNETKHNSYDNDEDNRSHKIILQTNCEFVFE